MDKEMRRLDACINACAGISTEALKSGAIRELVEAATNAMEAVRTSDYTAQRRAQKAEQFNLLKIALAKLDLPEEEG